MKIPVSRIMVEQTKRRLNKNICSHGVRRQSCPATRTTSVNWAKGWSLPFFSVWQNWHNTQEGVLGHGHQEAEHPLQVQGLPSGLSTHGQNPGKFPEQMISQVGGSGSITVTPKPTSKPQPVICHPPIGVIHLNTHRCHLNNHRCHLNTYVVFWIIIGVHNSPKFSILLQNSLYSQDKYKVFFA